ncbi:TPA: elongation factor Ts [Legionella pneumophila subsp. pneumophila]|uniref:Elongation factor Ts n=1 Tax=Legionella pneumophila (strain Lens) TaxID=297245 RepID=EFTS_LEGPL|nr:translation elongation factor Ts [Legionella pneumophila]Q5WVY8.1 RecName: Full=Elongation factor Ts; Short=EF-Ts [Legionella pneumophila str. Lens]AOW51757.1 translation elongation factor Ts [Legionella pneumophila subsp. pneumophila]AOW54647.1 translation elongation factor Ts [Legionella pneumophila subsp. pneumophila]AOW57052.1 translation elongation factor Ts [Legionella pneumophila subsp. pneumophila]AOW60020.1 translation elongation factor Ts [Legionella pneumophila subsp. pneumophila
MSTISAALVMQLRERTGAGMMECKKFLIATNGDIEQAIIEMRKAGQAKADKKADRVAAEGIIVIARSSDERTAVMLEINSETDFVARDENFTNFANAVADIALTSLPKNIEDLSNQALSSGATVEQARQELVAKIGENIKLRRLEKMHCDGVIGYYLHGSRIGVMVALKNGSEALAKDIAMHVAASKPMVVSRDQVPAEAIENEREIFTAQAKESGKPQEIIDKMIDGRINKFIDEVSLLGQPYVKDPNIKVGQLLKEKNAEVISFVRYEVGEGIEKKEDNFVEEVMAQVRT